MHGCSRSSMHQTYDGQASDIFVAFTSRLEHVLPASTTRYSQASIYGSDMSSSQPTRLYSFLKTCANEMYEQEVRSGPRQPLRLRSHDMPETHTTHVTPCICHPSLILDDYESRDVFHHFASSSTNFIPSMQADHCQQLPAHPER